MERCCIECLQSVIANKLLVVGAGEEDCFGDVICAVEGLSSSAKVDRSKVVAAGDLTFNRWSAVYLHPLEQAQ